jgi:hypothetical protein
MPPWWRSIRLVAGSGLQRRLSLLNECADDRRGKLWSTRARARGSWRTATPNSAAVRATRPGLVAAMARYLPRSVIDTMGTSSTARRRS